MGSKSGAPELSSQEKNLIGQQTDLLKAAQGIIQGSYGDFLGNRSQLFNLAGYKTQPNPQAGTLNKQADSLQTALDKWKAGQKDLSESNLQYISSQEKKIADLRAKATNIGKVTPTGPSTLPFAQVPSGAMPELEKVNQQVFDALTQNIKTFDPNRPDPFVEEQLRRAREAETLRLAQRMGPGADVSSAGLESLSKLSLNEILSRDAARRQNYETQLRQFGTLGTLGLQTSGEMFNRRAGLRQEANQNVLANEGFRQQRLSELSSLFQMPMAFAGPLGGTASGFNSPLAAYAGARQPPGPSAGQTLAGAGGGALSGAALGGSIAAGNPWAIGGGALIGGLSGLFS